MGIGKLISVAAFFVMAVTSTGQLSRIFRAVHIAQLHLIKESQSSRWGRAMLLKK